MSVFARIREHGALVEVAVQLAGKLGDLDTDLVVRRVKLLVGLRWVRFGCRLVGCVGRGRWQVVHVPVQQFSRSWMASRIW